MASSGLKGMNVEQGRSLSKSMLNNSDTITGITSQLQNQLQNTEWLGQDADQFRDKWNSEYSKSLKIVAEALSLAGQHLNQEADAQDQASNS